MSSDLLSAASLVVTAVTLLYASWYEGAQAARDLAMPRFRADRDADIKKLRAVLRSRALPLMLAATAMATVFAPTALAVAWQALRHGWGREYDVLKASFFVVWCLGVILAVTAANTVRALYNKLQAFRAEDAA